MIVIVDGDNSPGTRTEGVSALCKEDELYIYYSSNNKFYLDQSNQNVLRLESDCNIHFKKIKDGKNAVDFAVAMDMATLSTEEKSTRIVLISGDKHFRIIANQLAERYHNPNVFVENNIYDAVLKHKLPEIKSVEEVKNYWTAIYGHGEGLRLHEKIAQLYTETKAMGNKRQSTFITNISFLKHLLYKED